MNLNHIYRFVFKMISFDIDLKRICFICGCTHTVRKEILSHKIITINFLRNSLRILIVCDSVNYLGYFFFSLPKCFTLHTVSLNLFTLKYTAKYIDTSLPIFPRSIFKTAHDFAIHFRLNHFDLSNLCH